MDSGKFREEIAPVPVSPRNRPSSILDTDETPMRDTTLEKLSKLIPIYSDGVCTAGNSSTENDGAAAVVLMTETKAKELNIEPTVCLKAFAIAATDPILTYPAVPASVSKVLKKVGITIDQVDLFEIQEAFAVQALADAKLMGISPIDFDHKINVNGSGISLGHMIAATGAMRLLTLISEMKRRGSKYGLVTICGGGGQGISALLEAG